jgi:hypothetical protein
MKRRRKPRPVLGWREWIELPELCATPVKAKIDTGARTSALHAHDLEIFEAGGVSVAAFELHPLQRSAAGTVRVEWPVLGFRRVRSSNGRVETRPVIVTTARIDHVTWPIEITLASRDEMGFRMLLGRSAVRRRFLVDPGRSFLAAKAPKKPKKPRRKP